MGRVAESAEWTAARLAAALSGPSPGLLRRMSAGFAIIGAVEDAPGCCVLVAASPFVERLTDLPRERRLQFLADMDRLGEAVQNVCARRDTAFQAVDLSVRAGGGALHADVRPTYAWQTTTSPTAGQRADPRQGIHGQLVAELARISAAERADYPDQHVYGSRPGRRAV